MFKQGLLPDHAGILIPKTSDGRLIFVINYLGHAMVGTTDEKTDIAYTITPPQKDIDFIINELKAVFGEDFDYENNLLSSWAGARPLVLASKEEDTIEV
jgi:glycerol-3-phosphate dehydrogenase